MLFCTPFKVYNIVIILLSYNFKWSKINFHKLSTGSSFDSSATENHLHSYPNTTRMLHSRSSRIPKSADQVSKEERHLARLSVRSWTTSLTTADCVTNITRPCYKLFLCHATRTRVSSLALIREDGSELLIRMSPDMSTNMGQ